MMTKRDEYSEWISDEMEVDSHSKEDVLDIYLNNMKKLGIYADNYVLAAAVEVYPIDLTIVGSQEPAWDCVLKTTHEETKQTGIIGHVGSSYHFVLFVDKPTHASVPATPLKNKPASFKVDTSRKQHSEEFVNYTKLLEIMNVEELIATDLDHMKIFLEHSKSYSKYLEPIIQV